MKEINIIIDAIPTGKGRPRLSTREGFAWAYTPQKTRNAEAEYRRLITEKLPKGFKPFTGALKVEMVFGMPIPASTSIKKRIAIMGKPHVKKPDLDNLIKLPLDAMNGVIQCDDSQICELSAVKVYADKPFINITVEDLGDGVTYL